MTRYSENAIGDECRYREYESAFETGLSMESEARWKFAEIVKEMIEENNNDIGYIEQLLAIDNKSVNNGVLQKLRSNNTPQEIIEGFKNHESPIVRRGIMPLLENPYDLLHDEDPKVRLELAYRETNPELLINDEDEKVRAKAMKSYELKKRREEEDREYERMWEDVERRQQKGIKGFLYRTFRIKL